MDILPYLGLDTAAIRSFVADLEARYPSDFVPAQVDDSDVTMPETIDENTEVQTITVTVGRSGVSLAGLCDEMLTAYNNNVFTVSYDTASQDPRDVDLDALWAKHCTAPPWTLRKAPTAPSHRPSTATDSIWTMPRPHWQPLTKGMC